MNTFLIALVLQSVLVLPPRTAIENPAAVAQVPPKLKKDYDKMWARFVAGKEDAKLVKDIDKFLKKQKSFDPALMIKAYLDLYKGDEIAARAKFTQALAMNAGNRIAVYYLAELAYAHNEYARATTLYAQLLVFDPSRSEIETKRQRSLLLAIDNLLRSAVRAEGENRLAEAEQFYRQSLSMVPRDPTLHAWLADLLTKANKKDEAEAERKIVEELTPRRTAPPPRRAETARADTLEDLGRWGRDIELFHQIRSAETLTREQFAALLSRYFPQVTELRQSPQILTDTQNSFARAEIQTVVGIGLMDQLPNHTFGPSLPITRGDFATALARLSRLLSLAPSSTPPVATPDVAPSYAGYADIQLVLGYGVVTLADSGGFNVSGQVSGREAVRSAEQLLRTFQQAQH